MTDYIHEFCAFSFGIFSEGSVLVYVCAFMCVKRKWYTFRSNPLKIVWPPSDKGSCLKGNSLLSHSE